MKILVTHGTQDMMVPVERARESATWSKQAGAEVTTCEANVGHRISANCLHALTDFLK